MRLSQQQIRKLQRLLKEQFGLDYTDEEAQEAGLAIIRIIINKAARKERGNERRETD